MKQSFQKAAESSTAFWLAIAAILIGAGIRLHGLSVQSLWADELFTAMYAMPYLPGEHFIDLLMEEPHPPLYYIAMRLWLRVVPMSEFWMRVPSAVTGALTPAVFFWGSRRIVGDAIAAAGCILLAFSSFCLLYAQEARFYAPLLLAATVSACVWIRCLVDQDQPKMSRLALLAVVNIVTSLIHLFGFLLAGFEWLALFIMVPRLRTMAGFYFWSTLSLLPYLAWLWVSYPHFSKMVGKAYWLTRLSTSDLISPLRSLFAQPSVLLILAVPFLLNGRAVWAGWRSTLSETERRIVWACIGVSVGIIVFSMIVSFAFTVIYLNKNFVVIFPLVYLAIAVLYVRLSGPFEARSLYAIFGVMGVSLLTFLVTAYPLRTASTFYTPYKEETREAVTWIWDHAKQNDTVVIPAWTQRDPSYFTFRIYTDHLYGPAKMDQVKIASPVAEEQVKQLAALATDAKAAGKALFIYDRGGDQVSPEAIAAVLRQASCSVIRRSRGVYVLAIYTARLCTNSDLSDDRNG